jgi:hypothetical protein
MQEYTINGRGRVQRHRARKAGKEVPPSIRSQRAEWVREAAKEAGVSVRTINRHVLKLQLEGKQCGFDRRFEKAIIRGE